MSEKSDKQENNIKHIKILQTPDYATLTRWDIEGCLKLNTVFCITKYKIIGSQLYIFLTLRKAFKTLNAIQTYLRF